MNALQLDIDEEEIAQCKTFLSSILEKEFEEIELEVAAEEHDEQQGDTLETQEEVLSLKNPQDEEQHFSNDVKVVDCDEDYINLRTSSTAHSSSQSLVFSQTKNLKRNRINGIQKKSRKYLIFTKNSFRVETRRIHHQVASALRNAQYMFRPSKFMN